MNGSTLGNAIHKVVDASRIYGCPTWTNSCPIPGVLEDGTGWDGTGWDPGFIPSTPAPILSPPILQRVNSFGTFLVCLGWDGMEMGHGHKYPSHPVPLVTSNLINDR